MAKKKTIVLRDGGDEVSRFDGLEFEVPADVVEIAFKGEGGYTDYGQVGAFEGEAEVFQLENLENPDSLR